MAPFFKSSSLFSIAHHRLKVKEKKSPNLFQSSSSSFPPALYSRSLPNMQGLHDTPSRFIEEFCPTFRRKATVACVSTSSTPGEQSTLQVVASSDAVHSPEQVSTLVINPPNMEAQSIPRIDSFSFPISSLEPVLTSENISPKIEEKSTFRVETSNDPTSSPVLVLISENNSSRLDGHSITQNDSLETEEQSALHKPIDNSVSFKLNGQSSSLFGSSNDYVPTSKLDEQSITCVRSSNDSTFELDGQSTPRVRFFNNSILHFELNEQPTGVESSSDSVSSFELDGQSTPRAASYSEPVSFDEPVSHFKDKVSESSVLEDDASEATTGIAMNGQSVIMSTSYVTPLAIKRRALTPEGFSRTSIIETTWSNPENAKLLKEIDDLALIFRIPEGAYEMSSMSSRVSKYDHEHIIAGLEKSLAETKDLKERFMVELEELWGDYNELNNVYYDLKSEYQIEKMKNVKLTQSTVSIKHDAFKLLNKQEWEISQMKRFIAAMVDIKLHTPVLYNASEAIQNGTGADAALINAIKSAAEKADSPWSAIMPAIVGERPQELYLRAVKRSATLCGELRESNKKYKWWKMKAQMDPRHANSTTPSSSSVSLVLNAIMPEPKEMESDCVDNLLNRLKAGKPITMVTPVIIGTPGFRGTGCDIPPFITGTPASDISQTPLSSSEADSLPTGAIAQSPECSTSIADESGSIIRPYVPGRALFGENGLGKIPAGLFDSDSPEDLPDSPIPSEGGSRQNSAPSSSTVRAVVACVSNNFSNSEESLGLEYIEYHDSGFVDAIPSCGVESTVVNTAGRSSEPPESFGVDYFDEIPFDGRCNPVLRDSDSDNSSIKKEEEVVLVEFAPQTDWVSESVLKTEALSEEPNDIPRPVLPFTMEKNDVLETTQKTAETKERLEVLGSSSLKSVAQLASNKSITSLKRLTASSSKLRLSISGGLERLRRISFGSKKSEQITDISHPMTIYSHRRIPSASGKENKPLHAKGLSAGSNNTPISSRPATSIPRRGLRRPTISSTLKTIQVSSPPNHPQISQPGTQKKKNRVSFESPVVARPPAGKRAPLSSIPVPHSNVPWPSTHRKVLDKGRKAVRTITKLIS